MSSGVFKPICLASCSQFTASVPEPCSWSCAAAMDGTNESARQPNNSDEYNRFIAFTLKVNIVNPPLVERVC